MHIKSIYEALTKKSEPITGSQFQEILDVDQVSLDAEAVPAVIGADPLTDQKFVPEGHELAMISPQAHANELGSELLKGMQVPASSEQSTSLN
jgi:hypothetical protein